MLNFFAIKKKNISAHEKNQVRTEAVSAKVKAKL